MRSTGRGDDRLLLKGPQEIPNILICTHARARTHTHTHTQGHFLVVSPPRVGPPDSLPSAPVPTTHSFHCSNSSHYITIQSHMCTLIYHVKTGTVFVCWRLVRSPHDLNTLSFLQVLQHAVVTATGLYWFIFALGYLVFSQQNDIAVN